MSRFPPLLAVTVAIGVGILGCTARVTPPSQVTAPPPVHGVRLDRQAGDLHSALLPHYRIFRPEGPGPFPAVLFLSGCSGFEHPRAPRHYDRSAERFRQAGRAVIFVDYVRASGVPDACRGVLTPNEVRDYVLTSIAHVRAQPTFDRSALDIVGWSLGGGGVLAALAALPKDGESGVRRAVVLYPDCTDVEPPRAAVPTLVLLAGRDVIQPPSRCQRATTAAFPPARVEVRTYDKAHHGFDMADLPTELAPGLPALAYDEAAAAAAWIEIGRFLGYPLTATGVE